MLNERQLEAVNLPLNEANLVLAGAGSGKTTLLVSRIAKIVNMDGVLPHKVMAVTFTKKSANEMTERLVKIDPKLKDVLSNTFHGACIRIMRRLFNSREFVSPVQLTRWSIIDTDDQKRLVRDIIKANPYNTGVFKDDKSAIKATINFINRAKENMMRYRHIMITPQLPPHERYMATMYDIYERKCQAGGLFDFTEIILFLVEAMRDFESVRNVISSWFDSLIVDEFQDTNKLQFTLLQLILNGRECLFVVGDDDQSIYAFRGCSSAYVLKFPEYFKRCNMVTLEQNYRSTGHILAAANSIISKNEDRHSKTLFTALGDGEEIQCLRSANPWREADDIADQIAGRINNGEEPKEIAILVRTKAQTGALEKSLAERGIPYSVTGGLNFFERQEIKTAIAYARLALNPMDSAAFVRVCEFPKRGLGDKKIAQLTYEVLTEGLTFQEALSEQKAKGAQELSEILKRLEGAARTMSIGDFMMMCIHDTGVSEYFTKIKDRDAAESKTENLQVLIEMARRVKETMLADEFIEQTALIAEGSKKGDQSNAVSLSTIHGAKGLEWNTTYIAGFVDGIFPHGRAVSEGQADEERRLAYVAITRARRNLILSAFERDMAGNYTEVSEFLHDTNNQELIDQFQESEVSGYNW